MLYSQYCLINHLQKIFLSAITSCIGLVGSFIDLIIGNWAVDYYHPLHQESMIKERYESDKGTNPLQKKDNPSRRVLVTENFSDTKIPIQELGIQGKFWATLGYTRINPLGGK